MAALTHLVLVRHGESEGNLVSKSLRGDGINDLFYRLRELSDQPDIDWRLTPRGVEQAQAAGEWIKEHIIKVYGLPGFERYFSSPHRRAFETAGHLGIEGALWQHENRLRERSWGEVENLAGADEHRDLYPRNYQQMVTNLLSWTPPGGESIQSIADTRVASFLESVEREEVHSALASTHGEWILAARMVMGFMLTDDLRLSKIDPAQKINNAQVVHYTTLDPETGKAADYLRWVRSVCPWQEDTTGNWRLLERRYLNNAEMVAYAEEVPRLLEAD